MSDELQPAPLPETGNQQYAIPDLPKAQNVAPDQAVTDQGTADKAPEMVNVFDPEGKLVSIPLSQFQRATEDEGYKPATDKDAKLHELNEKYGSGWQQAITAVEHGASAATFGLSTGAERLLGVKGEDIRGRTEANPVAAGLGSIAGLVGTAFIPGLGEAAIANDVLEGAKTAEEAAILAKKAFDTGSASAEGVLAANKASEAAAEHLMAQKVAAEALNPISATSLMANAGRRIQEGMGIGQGAGTLNAMKAAATRGAVENALFSSGDILSRTFAGDPPETFASALSEIGLSSVIGGAFSAPFGAVAPLWKAASEAKLTNETMKAKGVIGDAIERLKYHIENPDPVTHVSESFQKAFDSIDEGSKLLYESGGLKENEIKRLLPNNPAKAFEEASNYSDKGVKLITQLQRDEAPRSIINRVSEAFARFDTHALEASDSNEGYKMYEAINKLKQELGGLSKFEKGSFPNVAERDALSAVKNTWGDIQKGLEDENVWGKAGKVQKEINEAFSSLQGKNGPLAQARKTFMRVVDDEWKADPGKFQTYLNQLGKPNAEIKQSMLSNFLEGHDNFHKVINKIYEKAGIPSPLEKASTSALEATTGKLSAGAKIADAIVKRGAARVGGASIGIGVGVAGGSLVGMPGFGAIVGEHGLGPAVANVLPSVVKPILEFLSKPGSKISKLAGVVTPEPVKHIISKAIDSSVPITGAAVKAGMMYSAAAIAGEHRLDKKAKDVFKEDKDLDVNLDTKKLQKNLEHHSSNDIKSMENVGGDIHHYFPDHQTTIASTAGGAVAYLQSQKFNRTPASVFDAPPTENDSQRSQYERTLAIAEHPTNIFAYIKNGQLTPKDIQDLKAMYPAMYNKMVNKLTGEMIEQTHKGNAIPYHTRMSLALFTGQPLDSTMTPMSIQAAQQVGANARAAQEQSQASQTKNLGKINKSYQTPTQARESERSAGK